MFGQDAVEAAGADYKLSHIIERSETTVVRANCDDLWMLYENYLYYVEESEELRTTEERMREIVREELERHD